MLTKGLWRRLACLGLVGLGPAVGCGSSDTNVGAQQGPVASGQVCTDVNRTAPTADGCNTCQCGADNRWICTHRTCASPPCQAGATKPADDGCNTCTCASDGTWGCTEKACTACTPGDKKPAGDGCNTCTCTELGAFTCTTQVCQGGDCPAPAKVPDGTTCETVVVWAKSPSTSTCCMYGTPCETPTGWTRYTSESACQAPACPAPAAQPPGTVCAQSEVYAKDPSSGTCCMYADSCGPPTGWKRYGSESECTMASSCAPPAQPPEGTGCIGVVAYGKDPSSGACCMYADPCHVPSGWKVYNNEADCEAGK